MFADKDRAEVLLDIYNERFNRIRPREYDGSHLFFDGMNEERELRQHQKDVIARIVYNGTCLMAHYLLSEFDGQPDRIWQSNIFGKSLHDLVSEGLNNKLKKMPEDARGKLQETLQRIINEGSGGLICIIL